MAAIALALLGCAAKPPISSEAQLLAWQQHRQQVSRLGSWSFSGRVSIKTDTDAWSGQLRWEQGDDHYQIHFAAPFGQGAFQLLGTSTGVEMRLSDGQVFQARDAETLLNEQLGWHFPLQGLRHWVMGVPAPNNQPSIVLDEAGRLARFVLPNHWQVSYPDYQTWGGIDLPRKVFVENTELNVRLVIDRWELNRG